MNASGRIQDFDYEPGGCGTQILFIIAVGIALFLTGCKSVEYVPVPEYHHDSIYFTKVQFDSIWQHDSIYVREYTKGDTVYLEHTKWHTKYKEVAVHDTSYVERIDSVSVPVPVERKLSRWEQIRLDYGGYALLIVIFAFIYIIYRLTRKFLP